MIRLATMDIKMVFICFALLVGVQFGRSLAKKRKLCAEYIVIGRQRQLTNMDLATYINITDPECMLRCVRHCMAYNTWRQNGSCQLQTIGQPCDELMRQKLSTFVKLRKCDGRAPWKVETLSWNTYSSCVICDRFDTKQECPAEYLRGPDGVLCIALVPIDGIYLPGWHRPNKKISTWLIYMEKIKFAPITVACWRWYQVTLPPGTTSPLETLSLTEQ